MWEELIMTILPYVLTFLIGLIAKSPYYQRPKVFMKEFVKAIEDEKIDREELEKLRKLIESK